MDAIIAHAREAAPNECCGLLVGAGGRIDESVRTRNLEEGPTRYQVDPAEHIALARALRGTPRQIVGTYHSHPSSEAVPSPSDVAEAFYPDFVYLIVSLVHPSSPEIRGYRIASGNFAAIPLVPVP